MGSACSEVRLTVPAEGSALAVTFSRGQRGPVQRGRVLDALAHDASTIVCFFHHASVNFFCCGFRSTPAPTGSSQHCVDSACFQWRALGLSIEGGTPCKPSLAGGD